MGLLSEHATGLMGSVAKERPMLGSEVQARVATDALTVRPFPRRFDTAAMATTAPIARVLPHLLKAPYAYQPTATPRAVDWRKQTATTWVRWHMGLAFVALASAAPLIFAPGTAPVGISLLVVALVSLGIGATALRFIDYASPAGAALLMLVCDGLATGTGIRLLGPHLELVALLPGALLITALLVDQALTIAAGILGLAGYVGTVAFNQAGILRPTFTLDAHGTVWLDLVLAVVGIGLLLVAVTLAMSQLRTALANEAAAAYTVRVLERRAQTKRVTLDADAIMLQAELAKTLRGRESRKVITCPDLAPLAAMINSTTERVPGLLRDREERLRLEKAIRDLVAALETAWAGYEWSWPAPTGTAIDRLVTILRPQRPRSEAV